MYRNLGLSFRETLPLRMFPTTVTGTGSRDENSHKVAWLERHELDLLPDISPNFLHCSCNISLNLFIICLINFTSCHWLIVHWPLTLAHDFDR